MRPGRVAPEKQLCPVGLAQLACDVQTQPRPLGVVGKKWLKNLGGHSLRNTQAIIDEVQLGMPALRATRNTRARRRTPPFHDARHC